MVHPRPLLADVTETAHGPLVAVANDHGQGRAQGHTVLNAGEDLDAIGFFARRGQPALAGTPPVEIRLDIGLLERHAGGTAVHDAAERTPVAFAERRDDEQRSETVT